MIEFILVLPLIIIFIAAVINFGAILSQTQHITTSLRTGARAVGLTNTAATDSCSTLKELAITQAEADFEYRAPPPSGRWRIDPTETVILTDNDAAVTPDMQVIKIVGVAKDEDNCLLCWQDFLARITPKVTVVFKLPKGCV